MVVMDIDVGKTKKIVKLQMVDLKERRYVGLHCLLSPRWPHNRLLSSILSSLHPHYHPLDAHLPLLHRPVHSDPLSPPSLAAEQQASVSNNSTISVDVTGTPV